MPGVTRHRATKSRDLQGVGEGAPRRWPELLCDAAVRERTSCVWQGRGSSKESIRLKTPAARPHQQAISAMHAEGKSIKEISTELELNFATVYRVL